jgi:hypothetical protein
MEGKMAEKWEYWSGILRANIENKGAKELIAKRWPDWKPDIYVPQAMMPQLNGFGEKGWELVSLQPVAGSGQNADILFPGDVQRYSNVYFCVFKRKIE